MPESITRNTLPGHTEGRVMSRSRICGTVGCTEGADAVIDHPVHGKRTVCDDHSGDYPVIAHV